MKQFYFSAGSVLEEVFDALNKDKTNIEVWNIYTNISSEKRRKRKRKKL